jgi:hypothetical protein
MYECMHVGRGLSGAVRCCNSLPCWAGWEGRTDSTATAAKGLRGVTKGFLSDAVLLPPPPLVMRSVAASAAKSSDATSAAAASAAFFLLNRPILTTVPEIAA